MIHVVTLTPRSPQEVEAERPDPLVCRALAARVAAMARMEALEKNRCGDYEGPRHVLRRAADAIVAIAHGDARVLDLAGALRAEAADYVTDMAPLERKRRHFAAPSTLHSRDVEGKARRTTRQE